MIEIRSLNDYENAITSNDAMVIMFSSDSCRDCLYAHHFMQHVEALFKEVTFYQVKREVMPQLSIDLNIYGIPSFIVYINGVVKDTWINKERKHFDEIVRFLKKAFMERT